MMDRLVLHLVIIPALVAMGCGSSLHATGDADEDPTDTVGDTGLDVGPDSVTDTPADTPVDIPPGCGDGDVDAGEECDDGNGTDGDGCDNDCTWSCEGDTECDDSDACTLDACDTSAHTCSHEAITCEDSDPCTTDGCDPASGCTFTPLPLWYRDGDDDGYGNPDDSVCAASAPEGYVDNDDDCCDIYPVVNPGITAYFVEPYLCGSTGTHPTYDYNCDGTEEPRYTAAGYCDSGPGSPCVAHEGWRVDYIPGCGESAAWLVSCGLDPTSGACIPNGERDQIQTCR